jgi:pantoate--beta-alanine ligase
MVIFHLIKETQDFLKNQQQLGKTIGFVPTMGALHAGHISLIEQSKQENDLTVCSIFVNPTQFNNPADLEKYPRTLEKDAKMLEDAGCDVVFAPSAALMYPTLPVLKMDFGILETVMEGKFRPGHFNGVGIVVSKLFNIIKPNRVYFGLKDLQQVAVIKQMVKDLNFDLELIACSTLREADGLAMSSRNMRLSEEDRGVASQIYQTLQKVKNDLEQEKSALVAKRTAKNYLKRFEKFRLEYI